MIRTQVQLTEEQHRRLRALAAADGISLAELIRRGVDQVLADYDRAERWERFMKLGGSFSSDASDVSEDHDRYLEEIYRDG